MKIVLIIDSRGNIAKMDPDTIARHSEYSRSLQNDPKREFSKLAIIGICNRPRDSDSNLLEDLNLITTRNQITYLFSVFSFISKLRKSNDEIRVLVAGDPWLSFLNSIYFLAIYRITLPHRPKPRIQIQLHADIFDRAWYTQSLKNRLKRKLSFLPILIANQVRCTTNEQARNVLIDIPRVESRIVVIPVPLNLPSDGFQSFPDLRTRDIGLCGRIDSDRGLDVICDFLQRISRHNISFNFIVLGDGPLRDEFSRKLSGLFGENRITFLGQLSDTEFYNALSNLGFLISFAPSESYGRAIREALAFGVPVLSIDSSGVRSLQLEVNNNWLRIIDMEIPDIQLCTIVEELFGLETDSSLMGYFQNSNHQNSMKIANTWRTLSDTS
jgi:glycosyltransferase involved in cell wall biosynthesis